MPRSILIRYFANIINPLWRYSRTNRNFLIMVKTMKRFLFLVIIVFSTTLFADERGDVRAQLEPKGFLYGFGLGVSKEIYQGYDRRIIPLPILGYRSEKLAIYGPFISYEVLEFNDIEIEALASPRFQGFDDSDSDIFIGMDKRKFSMDAGLSAKYERDNWKISVSALYDILSRSDGYELKAKLGRAFQSGPVFFEPNISVSYLDKNHVDYYYGVREHEATVDRPYYLGQDAMNAGIGISVATPILLGGFTQFAVDYNWYDTSITQSPIVEDKHNISFRLLFSKFF